MRVDEFIENPFSTHWLLRHLVRESKLARKEVVSILKEQMGIFFLKCQLMLASFMLVSLFMAAAVYADTVRDEFNTIAYNGNDGNHNWSNDWQELGESDGPTGGQVRVVSSSYAASGNALQIGGGSITGRSLSREADLTGASSATLTFSYRRWQPQHPKGRITLSVSSDGGANWTDLQTYRLNGTDPSQVPQTFDITFFIASNTQIRFLGSGKKVGNYFYADNIQIEYASLAPDIILLKSVQTFSDPFNGESNPKAIPGGVMLYTITATNQGDGATDADTVFITDPIPANTALFVGDIDGSGPATGPVLFTDGTPPNDSGLNYTFTSLDNLTDDVAFSNDGGTTYNYIPVPDGDGLDTNVTHMRINPKDTFNAASSGNIPSFEVKFKVRVE